MHVVLVKTIKKEYLNSCNMLKLDEFVAILLSLSLLSKSNMLGFRKNIWSLIHLRYSPELYNLDGWIII